MFLSLLATLLVTAGAKTIAEVAQGTGNHAILVEAVTKAKLVDTFSGPGPLTVFAPTDQAFAIALENLGLTKEQLLEKPDLAEILKYHVLSAKVMSADLKATQSPATVQGATVPITKAESVVKFADAKVTTADVEASNGVVHVIDKVVLPPTIVDIAKGSADHKVLVEAVVAAKLTDTLSGVGPFTVFAPTDQAFANALEKLDLTKEQLLDKSDLADILKYHVLSGKVLSTDLEATQSPATVQGEKVTITKDGSVVKFKDASVSAADIVAGNGVIHVIDKVVLPPADAASGAPMQCGGGSCSGVAVLSMSIFCAMLA